MSEKPEEIKIPEDLKEIFSKREQLWSDTNTDLRRFVMTLNTIHEIDNKIIGDLIKKCSTTSS
jgi:hypothetical protein